jgi:hypothetical protein
MTRQVPHAITESVTEAVQSVITMAKAGAAQVLAAGLRVLPRYCLTYGTQLHPWTATYTIFAFIPPFGCGTSAESGAHSVETTFNDR